MDPAEENLRRGNPAVAAAVAAAIADIPPATDPASYNSPPGEYALWASAGAVAVGLGAVSLFVFDTYEFELIPLVCLYFVFLAIVSGLGFLLGPNLLPGLWGMQRVRAALIPWMSHLAYGLTTVVVVFNMALPSRGQVAFAAGTIAKSGYRRIYSRSGNSFYAQPWFDLSDSSGHTRRFDVTQGEFMRHPDGSYYAVMWTRGAFGIAYHQR